MRRGVVLDGMREEGVADGAIADALAHWRVSGDAVLGLGDAGYGTGNPGCVATAGALKSDADGASSSKPTHVEVDAAAADDPRGRRAPAPRRRTTTAPACRR